VCERGVLLLPDTAYYARYLDILTFSTRGHDFRVSEQLGSPKKWRRYLNPSDASDGGLRAGVLAMTEFRLKAQLSCQTSVLARAYESLL
jgi:hypothetical protein